jgi:hypothetical protein
MERPDTGGRARTRAPSWRHFEAAALLACVGLLLWLESLPPVSLPEGYLGGAAFSLLLALATTLLAPGYVLWRLFAGDRDHPFWEGIPFSFAFGVAWLLIPASVVMLVRSDMASLIQAVVMANAIFVLAYVGVRSLGKLPRSAAAAAAAEPEESKRPSLWLLAAALAAAARALYVASSRPYRFTSAGDEWVYMRNIRRFLDAPRIYDPLEFDVWDVVLALVFRFSGLEVVGTYRRLLAPLLAFIALTAFLVLARRVFRDPDRTCMALTILIVYCLSDMYMRGEGAGMGLFVRIAEDKYACLLIALPLAQAAFLEFLGSRSPTALGRFVVLTLAATLVQPFAVPWLALSCGAVLVSGLVTRLIAFRRWQLAGLAVTVVAGTALAFWLRSLRPRPYYNLYDLSWDYNAILLELKGRQLLVLSLEKAWYLVHPWQINHPLVIAALVGSLFLLPWFRRSLSAQFLSLSALLPALLVFNPVTAPMLGRLVSPWRLHWLLWMVPTAMILATLLHALVARIEALALRKWALRRGRLIGVLGVVALAAVDLSLEDRMADSLKAFKAKNRVMIRPEEREFMRAVAGDATLAGRLLAPRELSVRLSAWTTRLQPVLTIDIVRSQTKAVIGPAEEFLSASRMGPKQAGYLTAARIDYVMAETGSPVDIAMRSRPVPFRLLHSNRALSLYAWRPQYWSALPDP